MIALLLLSAVAAAPRAWAEPREPFHVVGNVYSVGSAEVTSFLIATPKGHVLIDGGFAEYVKTPGVNLCKVPDHVSLEAACILGDAVATSYHAITKRAKNQNRASQ